MCKEFGVSFLHDPLVTPLVNVNGIPIEVVRNHKVLGIYIHDLKWDVHVDSISKKAAKRLYIRILKYIVLGRRSEYLFCPGAFFARIWMYDVAY